ncbi:peroxiredoxin [Desulfobacterota bacterium M19]
MTAENTRMPLLGDNFPELNVQTTHGGMSFPKDMKDKWSVFFSHPADFTPVCTTEFVAFQKRKKEFDDLGCQLIGLSIDQVFSHIKWVQWIKETLNVEIQFPIVSANDSIASKLGMLHPDKGTNTVRAVFIIDPQTKIRLIMYYPQEIGRNIDEIIRSVKALQVSDEQGAVPAGWPNNELIQDNIIVPPAQSEAGAATNTKKYENYDWWFCYKPLEK